MGRRAERQTHRENDDQRESATEKHSKEGRNTQTVENTKHHRELNRRSL